ncbi:MAG: DUF4189 domain-containing protein [Rhodospirillales bacterium]|nr:DUF4189 domain-containing protein [Rhodospirillales bacterium]
MTKISKKTIITVLAAPILILNLEGCLNTNLILDTKSETLHDAATEVPSEQYGAIAFSTTTQRWHIRWNVFDPLRAESLAIKHCGADDCSIILRFGPGQCGTFSLGNAGALSTGLGTTKEDTAAKALSECTATNQQCKVAPVLCNDVASG